MMLKLSLVLAAFALLFAACSPGSDERQIEPAAASVQVEQEQERQATAYEAGRSESAGEADREQAQEEGGEIPAASAGMTEEAGDGASEETAVNDEAEQSEQVPDQVGDGEQEVGGGEQEAMVAQIIESGHRAGLIANRNSVGDPDALIVITEYSDFL